jgi:myo-inositol-1(or 4)-monophosphatase
MGQASVEIGWSTRVPNGDYLAVCARVLTAGASFRRVGSGALGIAYVADGRQDAYVELHINAWDCLAGLLLVEEAGGRVSDFLAEDGLRRGNPVLVTAPGIAAAVVEATGIRLRPTAAP